MPQTGVAVVQGVLFEIDSTNGRCISAKRIDQEVEIG
jgi:hypothetical protein